MEFFLWWTVKVLPQICLGSLNPETFAHRNFPLYGNYTNKNALLYICMHLTDLAQLLIF